MLTQFERVGCWSVVLLVSGFLGVFLVDGLFTTHHDVMAFVFIGIWLLMLVNTLTIMVRRR